LDDQITLLCLKLIKRYTATDRYDLITRKRKSCSV